MHQYVLNSEGEPEPCEDLFEWAHWMERSLEERHIDGDYVTGDDGAVVFVSTVFLGLDHGMGRGAPPVLWETMVFNGDLTELQWRYTSKAAALAGHREALALVLSHAGEGYVHTNIHEHEAAR